MPLNPGDHVVGVVEYITNADTPDVVTEIFLMNLDQGNATTIDLPASNGGDSLTAEWEVEDSSASSGNGTRAHGVYSPVVFSDDFATYRDCDSCNSTTDDDIQNLYPGVNNMTDVANPTGPSQMFLVPSGISYDPNMGSDTFAVYDPAASP